MELAHMLTRIHITTIKKADKAYAVLNLFFSAPKEVKILELHSYVNNKSRKNL